MLCTVLCLYLGLTAARNMLGRKEEINTIPFFWTSQYGKSIRYCGKLNYVTASAISMLLFQIWNCCKYWFFNLIQISLKYHKGKASVAVRDNKVPMHASVFNLFQVMYALSTYNYRSSLSLSSSSTKSSFIIKREKKGVRV